MTNVLIVLTMPPEVQAQFRDRLRAAFPNVNIYVVDHHSKADPYIADAEILMTFGQMVTDEVVRQATKLQWIQSLGTGVDNLIDLPSLPGNVLVTSARGIHGAPVSEAVLMVMLALDRGLPRMVRNQDRHAWERWPGKLLDGHTVGIAGVGAIAEALAPRCKALGMRVVGISGGRGAVANFDRIFGRHELKTAVRELDYLVLLTPLSAETHNMVNAEILSCMKPTSFLINFGRGGLVDEGALIRALSEGQIAGAALDVFHEEPLPAEHPFWSMKNVIITPHMGGLSTRWFPDVLGIIEHNLGKFLAGDKEHMMNVVRRAGN